MKRTPDVIISDTIKPEPEQHERDIAWILARHFKCPVEFLQPNGGYKVKTPDIVMNGLMWEIKSPKGSSRKNTVESQFKGLKQSRNLVIDCRRTKLDESLVLSQIEKESLRHRVGKVIVIGKNGEVLDLLGDK